MILLAGMLPACGGSREDREPVYPVEGRMLYHGEPAAGAFVVFHPSTPDPDAPRPHGHVADDGRFTLTTYEPGDGAPVGSYRIAVVWPEANEKSSDNEMREEGRDRLGQRYASPENTPLEAVVETRTNTLETIELD